MRLIDADALKNYILDNPELLFTGYEDSLLSVHDVLWQIDQQPTIDAMPAVHGHWIDNAKIGDSVTPWIVKYECSECRARLNYGRFNYCPQCGAKMKEE